MSEGLNFFMPSVEVYRPVREVPTDWYDSVKLRYPYEDKDISWSLQDNPRVTLLGGMELSALVQIYGSRLHHGDTAAFVKEIEAALPSSAEDATCLPLHPLIADRAFPDSQPATYYLMPATTPAVIAQERNALRYLVAETYDVDLNHPTWMRPGACAVKIACGGPKEIQWLQQHMAQPRIFAPRYLELGPVMIRMV